ncbi:MAG: caspase family protein, partial [Saprospiraceae bacterium]|nr:caspase family protein [Saprospiraceae bacterium]
MNYLQHISQVLPNLSAEGREGSAAYRKLEQFDAQFAAYGEGHWMLAAHAAFPMLLTPDLLYRIWHNFQTFQDAAGQDQLIDRVAVSDLLLSPLLREIGTEVFEMPGKIRSALLSCLEKRFEQSDPERLYDLSQFLMQYYQYMPSGKNYIWDQMRDLQEWHAMAYMQPETAADQLREAMSDAVRSNKKGQQYRLQMLVEKLDQQFETLGKAERQDKSFQTLVAYTKGMQAFQEGEYQEAIESFADLPTVPAESEAGEGQDLFTITVPKAVQQELKKRDAEQPKGTLRANFVAINQYENISPLSAAVSDAERLKSWLQERVQNRPLKVQSLHDEAATEDAITGMLINTLEQAQSEDTVLFYFAGTGVELSQNGLQGPRSVFAGVDFQLVRDQPVGGISDQDMRNILQEYNRNNAFVCILFDACNVGTASWIDIDNPRHIMLSASRLQEKAFEIRTGGAFTTALLDILNAQEVIPNMNSLSMAIRDEVQRQFEEQTPQLFGHYQTRLRTFLNLGESREEDLLTRAFQEMDLWKESLSTSIQAFVERSELIDRAALLPWMSTFSTLKSTDQLEVLNLTGMDFVRLFRNIISELTSPVIRYQTENLEELDLPGYGNIVPPTNIQQQSNLGSYSLESEPEKRDYYSLILQPDVVMLPLNEWMVQQLSQNAELHDALMERWIRDRPVIPILMEACAWESTIAVRFAGQLLQTSPPEGPEAQRAQYEQSLKTYLGLWWQAQLMDLRKQIEDGRLSRVFMS